MHIKDSKHVHKHRVMVISMFIGIVVVFGVWAVQIKNMFAQQATEQVVGRFELTDETNYVAELEALVPGINQTFDDLNVDRQQEVALEQAQENSQELLIEELMQRFEQKAQEEASRAQEEAAALQEQAEETP